ncbi:hypothetical protein RFI_14418 [Reticulomyxa filosa]|uniref:Alcohol dehydrogenase-like C-terminal domain-containing protein n=1 Tax=Reticulomyxa filosa TaxID=46433 RepID=X6NAH5_RETFI|nr:hypothetical protein RFI_14418 [Reticulomyxa filosa]|eukprot:ETO22774.1 hypothetical protein RFI_14418 [Reticulomyxa filosa]
MYILTLVYEMKGTTDRNSKEFKEIKDHLHSLGANEVIGEDDLPKLSDEERLKLFGGNKNQVPLLAFNAVGGRVVSDMCKLLGRDATLVTYGGMSRKPVTIGTGTLVFQNISFTGFWMSRWKDIAKQSESGQREFEKMLKELESMVLNRELTFCSHEFPFGQQGEGLLNALKCLTEPSAANTQDGQKNTCPKHGKYILSFE